MPLTVSRPRVDPAPAAQPERNLLDRAGGASYGMAAAAMTPLCLALDSASSLAHGLVEPGQHRRLLAQSAFEAVAAATTAVCLPATLSVGCVLGATLGFKAIRYMLTAPIQWVGERRA